jgi:hypothetical protein
MRQCYTVLLTAVVAGCGASFPGTAQPPAARTIDFLFDLQPIIVTDEWNLSDFAKQTERLNAAFAPAGVAFQVSDPIGITHPEWEDVDSEPELREMMISPFDGLRIWLVRELGPQCICSDDGIASTADYGGIAYPPTHPCHGVALSIMGAQDSNTLVHEIGHAFGLAHPEEGPNACNESEVSGRYMSYCYWTRSQFTEAELDTIRTWAAALAGN